MIFITIEDVPLEDVGGLQPLIIAHSPRKDFMAPPLITCFSVTQCADILLILFLKIITL